MVPTMVRLVLMYFSNGYFLKHSSVKSSTKYRLFGHKINELMETFQIGLKHGGICTSVDGLFKKLILWREAVLNYTCTTWRNNRSSKWNSSRREPEIRLFKRRIQTFTGWNWNCHVIIMIKTDLPVFVVIIHSGLCKQYVKSLGLMPSVFDFLLHMRPPALWQQSPP